MIHHAARQDRHSLYPGWFFGHALPLTRELMPTSFEIRSHRAVLNLGLPIAC